MADKADIADDQYGPIHEANIEAARKGGIHLLGPAKCLQCGYPNDRRDEGYGTCTDCVNGDSAA